MLNENHRWLAAEVSLEGVDKPTMRMIATLTTPLKIPGRWLTFRRYISRWWPNKNLIIDNGENTDGRILGDPGAVSRAGRKGVTKVFKYKRKSPWVPTLTGP